MPLDTCNPCCDPSAMSRSKDTWMYAVLKVLCNIFQAFTGGDVEGGELLPASGIATASGDTDIVAAPGVGLSIYVYSERVMTLSTTPISVRFFSGLVEKSSFLMQTVSGLSTGANLAVSPPAYLYKIAENTALTINLSAAFPVDYSVNYFIKAS